MFLNHFKFSKAILVVGLTFMFGCSGAQKTTAPKKNVKEKPDTVKVVIDSLIEEKVEEREFDSLALAYPLNKKKSYNIAYLLPLFQNEYPNITSSNKRFSSIAFDYWWGSKLAFDTLKAAGFNAKVNLIDTRNDTALIKESISALKDTPDLFFGPLFPNNITYLQPYIAKSKANLISPLATIEDCNGYNDRTIFSKPTVQQLNQATADLILAKYDSIYPVVIFCRAVSYEEKEANTIKAFLSERLKNDIIIETVNKNYLDKNYLRGKLPDSAVVVICSDRESFVTSVIAELRRSLQPHKVVGRESWLDYQSMDTEAWARLDMHFISTSFIDYNNEQLQTFIKRYRRVYHAEPSKYAISGYFETIYYCLYLDAFGTNFQRFKNEISFDLPHASINLLQADSCKYFYNNQVRVLKFKKHELIEVE